MLNEKCTDEHVSFLFLPSCDLLSFLYVHHLGLCSKFAGSDRALHSSSQHTLFPAYFYCKSQHSARHYSLSVSHSLTSFTILSSLPSAFHSHASDPSRCFHPVQILSFVGLHLLLRSPQTLPPRQPVRSRNILDLHRASWIAAINLAGRAAAAQFAHLRQSMEITLRDYNAERLRRHAQTQRISHTHTHTRSSPANCWLLVCKSVIACLIKYRISNELR